MRLGARGLMVSRLRVARRPKVTHVGSRSGCYGAVALTER